MNKIVREHYPVDRLPEDLRRHLDPSRPVTLVIEQEDVAPAAEGSGTARLSRYFGAAKERNTSVEKAVARIRELRDEWE